jgi:hypothetical protein
VKGLFALVLGCLSAFTPFASDAHSLKASEAPEAYLPDGNPCDDTDIWYSPVKACANPPSE